MEQNPIDNKDLDKPQKSFWLRNINFNKKTRIIILSIVLLIIVIKALTMIPCFSKLFSNVARVISNSRLTANVISSSAVEDLGIQFQQLVSGGGVMFKDANGDPHWFVVYSGRAQFWDINLKTGATNYFNTGKSGLGSYTKALSGNKLFISVGDTCSLWEYDISTGTTRELKQSGSNNGCGSSTGGQSSYTAPDGTVYIGTVHLGTVIEIDPTTGNIRDFGIIDPPTGNPNCNGCPSRQIANIVADTNFVYALMRDTGTNSYWLAIINRSDGSLSASCEKDNRNNSGKVAVSVDGSQIWYGNNSSNYRIDNTNGSCPTTPGNPPSLKPWFFPSNVYFTEGDSHARAVSDFGVEIDATGIDVDTGTGGIATIKYRNPAGSGSWIEKTQSILMKDTQIKRIKAKDDNSAYLVAGTYGPNSIFNGSSSTVLGRTAQSTYAITPFGQYVYLSGYTANTFRYNPVSPWTVMGASTQTMCNASSPSNPCVAFQGMGKYHYYSAGASNGQFYIASTYKRGGRAGGDIGWINTTNWSTNSYAFNCDSPSGFALLSDGSTLAYASEADGGAFGCTNTVGKLFLFDTKTNTVTNSFTPVTGSPEQGAIIGTKDGGILGIAKDFPSAGRYTLYKIDKNGTHASWSPTVITGNIFGGSGQADRALIIAKDGMVYTWDSAGVVRINPTDGTVVPYLSSSSYITAMEFVGEDLYMAVGSNESRLKKIKGVNIAPKNDPNPTDPVDPKPTDPNTPKQTDPKPTDPVDPKPTDKSITAFNFNGLPNLANGIIDNSNNTISVSLAFGTDVTSLTPTISITGASITPNSGVAQNFTNPVTYTVTAVDGSTQQYIVTAKVVGKSAQDRKITAFNFESISPVVTGIINESIYAISLLVPFGTDVTSLTPTISITGASVNPNSGVPQNFTKPVTYSVTSVDGSIQQYTVTITILPKVNKEVEEVKKIIEKASDLKKEKIVKTNSTRTLRVGSYGDDVKELQVFLNKNGFTISKKGAGSPGKETKYFRISTRKALAKFQKANGLKADGILGPVTRAKIKELSK